MDAELTLLENLAQDHFMSELGMRIDSMTTWMASAAIQNLPLWETIKASMWNKASHLQGSLEVLREIERNADIQNHGTTFSSDSRACTSLEPVGSQFY